MPTTFCKWKYDTVDEIWTSRCKENFRFHEGGPIESGFEYCPFCGKEIYTGTGAD